MKEIINNLTIIDKVEDRITIKEIVTKITIEDKININKIIKTKNILVNLMVNMSEGRKILTMT